MVSTDGARTVEQWRRYLAEYSAEVLRVAPEDELHEVSDLQRSAGWLGFDGAGEGRLAVLEQRLGVRLPQSYRSFLAASDGWLNIGPFMWTMRTSGEVGWLRDADAGLWEILRENATPEETALVDRALLVSGDGDAQYWLLDPGDVSAAGEWAAYVWASWYPGLGDRYDSFAALVDAERASFEGLSGRDGRPVHPGGADELVAQGRERALRGEVRAAAEAFAHAAVKGSGAGAYLAVILNAFLDPAHAHHEIRNGILGHPHVVEEIGLEQVRAEAVPLFLYRSARAGSSVAPHRQLFAGILTEEEVERIDTFVPPQLPEPSEFQEALQRARTLAQAGATDHAWSVLAAALPGWHSDSLCRIAPVVLLTDPMLRDLVSPERARTIVTTPRGNNRY
ncbi:MULTISPECIES: SMI1/KNR4 family protein [unclassified Spirillospora]|uniref:SMI1/KNR4 family protein n=1 Tax=unclassified Spirillospora TaxID=2642701 RepID=UPI00371FF134